MFLNKFSKVLDIRNGKARLKFLNYALIPWRFAKWFCSYDFVHVLLIYLVNKINLAFLVITTCHTPSALYTYVCIDVKLNVFFKNICNRSFFKQPDTSSLHNTFAAKGRCFLFSYIFFPLSLSLISSHLFVMHILQCVTMSRFYFLLLQQALHCPRNESFMSSRTYTS